MTKWILTLLLLAQPVVAQIGWTNVVLTNVIVKQASGGTSAVPDWTSSFVAVYDIEGASPWNQTGGTCGANCNLTNSGMAQDSTTYQHNSASASADESDGVDYASCAYGTCTGITGMTGSYSVGAWFNNGDDTVNQQFVRNQSTGGFYLQFTASSDNVFCYYYDGASQYQNTDADTFEQIDGWAWVSCAHDASGGAGSSTISAYSASDNLWDKNTKSALSPMTANTGGDFYLASEFGVSAVTGNIDEAWIYDGVLSDAAMCRICSCGIDDSLCTYSGTTFVDAGRNTTECGSCTLCSDASASTPGACS